MGVKKFLMRQVWRLQQVQMIVSLVFWALALTGIFYPYLSSFFRDLFGERAMIFGMIFLFSLIVGFTLLVGIIYDVILRLWIEQNIICVERNPYGRWLLYPKEIFVATKIWVPLLRRLGEEEKANLVEGWINNTFEEDPETVKGVEEIERKARKMCGSGKIKTDR